MKFISIVTGPWNGGSGINHTLYGLTAEGNVYKWQIYDGWVPMKKQVKKPGKGPTGEEDPF